LNPLTDCRKGLIPNHRLGQRGRGEMRNRPWSTPRCHTLSYYRIKNRPDSPGSGGDPPPPPGKKPLRVYDEPLQNAREVIYADHLAESVRARSVMRKQEKPARRSSLSTRDPETGEDSERPRAFADQIISSFGAGARTGTASRWPGQPSISCEPGILTPKASSIQARGDSLDRRVLCRRPFPFDSDKTRRG